jgi:hypothetical protein
MDFTEAYGAAIGEQISTAMDVVDFCGCAAPRVVDRMCVDCKLPNLASMIAWRADGCRCRRPDNNLRGLQLRSCRRCEKPVFEVILQPQQRVFRRGS